MERLWNNGAAKGSRTNTALAQFIVTKKGRLYKVNSPTDQDMAVCRQVLRITFLREKLKMQHVVAQQLVFVKELKKQ